MSLPIGRWKSLSGMRGLVCDICRIGQSVPSIGIERKMCLSDVVAARQAIQPRPQWTAIFAKAYALASRDVPALLHSHVRLPWRHLYVHRSPVVCITVERELANEDVVFYAQVRKPDELPLTAIDEFIRHCKSDPVETVDCFRGAQILARFPSWCRMLALWWTVHGSARLRELFLGTFSITSTASLGAGLVQMISPMTGTLHYGLFDEQDRLDMRLTFDHRVLDGATAARALAAMEKHLHGAILSELRSLSTIRVAA